MDDVLKIIQMFFYIFGTILAIVTFLKALNTIFNPLKTEYEKKVIERLQLLSQELIDEFDPISEKHWANVDVVQDILHVLHIKILRDKENFLQNDNLRLGVPFHNTSKRKFTFHKKIKYDPFIPDELKSYISNHLDKHLKKMIEIYSQVITEYLKELKAGNHWQDLENNHIWVHTKVHDLIHHTVAQKNKNETSIAPLLNEIQDYLESHKPLKKILKNNTM